MISRRGQPWTDIPQSGWGLAELICRSLQGGLADLDAQGIVLTREEALITLGLVGSIPELMRREQASRGNV